MEATIRTLYILAGIWLLAILLTGFVLGFGQVLALLVGTGLLGWVYWRLVPRPEYSYQFQFLYSREA